MPLRRALNCRGLTVVAVYTTATHFSRRTGAAQLPADALAAQLVAMLTRTASRRCSTPVASGRHLALRNASSRARSRPHFTAGEPLFPADGIPIYLRGLPPDLLKLMREASTDEAVAAVMRISIGRRRGEVATGRYGRRVVKPMSVASAHAAVAEAHRRGFPVFAHPSNAEGATIAVQSGVDVLAHTNSQGWTPALVASMIEHRTALIPTLKLWLYESARQHASAAETDAFTAEAMAQLTAFVKSGGETLFGTDVGYMRDFDPADEYALMARAGMTPMQIRIAHHGAGRPLQKDFAARGAFPETRRFDGARSRSGRDATAFAHAQGCCATGAS
jgi:hypothetical protein